MPTFKKGDRVVLPSGKQSMVKGVRCAGEKETLYLCGTASWRGSYRPHGVFTEQQLRRAK